LKKPIQIKEILSKISPIVLIIKGTYRPPPKIGAPIIISILGILGKIFRLSDSTAIKMNPSVKSIPIIM